MADAGYFAHKYFENLFMNEKEVLDLANRSHCIGLHSHSHPTMIQDLDIFSCIIIRILYFMLQRHR